MPSTYESFGLVAVESMACGTPVVASRVGGLATIVRDGENGALVPWRDPRLFADRIRPILTDPVYAATLRRGAHGDGRTSSAGTPSPSGPSPSTTACSRAASGASAAPSDARHADRHLRESRTR